MELFACSQDIRVTTDVVLRLRVRQHVFPSVRQHGCGLRNTNFVFFQPACRGPSGSRAGGEAWLFVPSSLAGYFDLTFALFFTRHLYWRTPLSDLEMDGSHAPPKGVVVVYTPLPNSWCCAGQLSRLSDSLARLSSGPRGQALLAAPFPPQRQAERQLLRFLTSSAQKFSSRRIG